MLLYEAGEGDRRLQREVDSIFGQSEGQSAGLEFLFVHGQPNKVAFEVDLGIQR